MFERRRRKRPGRESPYRSRIREREARTLALIRRMLAPLENIPPLPPEWETLAREAIKERLERIRRGEHSDPRPRQPGDIVFENHGDTEEQYRRMEEQRYVNRPKTRR